MCVGVLRQKKNDIERNDQARTGQVNTQHTTGQGKGSEVGTGTSKHYTGGCQILQGLSLLCFALVLLQ